MNPTKINRGLVILSFVFIQCISAHAVISIDSQPASLTTAVDGSKVTIQVTASSSTSTPLLYQWYKGTSPAPGNASPSTSNQLVLTGAKVTDTGSYVVFITENGIGSTMVSSNPALLVVNMRPKFTATGQPKAITVTEGQAATFTATLDSVATTGGTPPFTYTWQRKNGTVWTDLSQNPNSPVFSDVFSIPSVQLSQAGSYKVMVRNVAGVITSAEAILKVNSRPVLASQPGKVVTVFQSDGSTAVSEVGATDTYTVVLSAPPVTGSTVTVTPSVTSPFFTNAAPASSPDVTISPSNAVFTDVNWSTPVVFTVTANDDAVANAFLAAGAPLDVRSVVISHSVASSDLSYRGAQISNFFCAVNDNESGARIVVTENSTPGSVLGFNGISVVTEGGTTDTFTIAFAGAVPTADVTVNFTVDPRITLSPASLTFTATNYMAEQSVTITAVNDVVRQGVQFLPLNFSTASMDASYATLSAPTLNVRVNDNDDAAVNGVTIIASGGDSRVVEGGMNDQLLIALDKSPTGDVFLTRANTGTDLASPGNLLFTTANWFIPQTVTASAIDDLFVEPTRTSAINYTASGGGYSVVVPAINVIGGDNDLNSSVGVRITQSGTTDVTEGGATDSFSVALTGTPASNVTITLGVNASTQASISGATLAANVLTFTPANWSAAQTVVVTAIDDALTEGRHSAAISFNLGAQMDPRYSQLIVPDVPVFITDNDNGNSVIIVQSGGSTVVTEGGPKDYFTVALSGPLAPIGTVTVNLAAVGTQINAPSPAVLTFNNLNWKVPQTVFVSAVDDAVSEEPHSDSVSLTTVSTDPLFTAIPVPNVPVSVYDNDSVGASGAILVTETDGSTRVVENGLSDTIWVCLRRAPSASVILTPTLSTGALDISLGTLTFTTADWNVPQVVTLSANLDLLIEGVETVTLFYSASATGGFAVQDMSAPISVVIGDATAGSKNVVITETGGSTSVTEDGPTAGFGNPNSKDNYRLNLSQAPTADVTITPVASVPGQLIFTPPSVTFTPGNFATLQTITVSAVSNTVAEADQVVNITHTVGSADSGYNNIPTGVVGVAVQDDDTTVGRVVVTETGGGTWLFENAGSDTVGIALTGLPPASNVTVNLVCPGSQFQFFVNNAPVTSTSLVFTPANYTVVQNVTLIGVDNAVAEGPHTSSLLLNTASGSPVGYTELSALLPVEILDNESVTRSLISIIEADGATRVIEGGVKDSYSMVLRRAPTANVVLTPVVDATQLTLATKVLTFTPANWNVPQNVTVTAFDDTILEGTHSSAVVYVAGNSGGYLSTDTATINVLIGDNEGILPALPSELYIAQKASGTLKITAAGNSPLLYQWYKNGVLIPKATTASLIIKGEDTGGPSDAVGPGNYYVEITNAIGNTLPIPALPTRSNVTAVRVIRKPTIKTDLLPARSFTLPPSVPLTMDVEAHTEPSPGVDYGTLRYQWQKDGKNIGDAIILAPAADPRTIAGSMTRTLTITPVSWLDRGAYKVVISNEVGMITSKATTVNVTAPPIIVTQPVNVTGPTGGSAKFIVVGGGTAPLSYQWSFSPDNNIVPFVNITAGKAATLSITGLSAVPVGVKPANMGYYKCTVSGSGATAVSNTVFLQVDEAPRVTVPVPVAPATAFVLTGSNIHLKVTATGTNTSANPLVYVWQKNGVNILGGPNSDTLILATTSTADSGNYKCVVSNLVGTGTSVGLAVNVQTAPSIPTQPVDATAFEDTPAALSLVAAGSPTLTYRWQRESQAFPGTFNDLVPAKTTATLSFPKAQVADSGNYRCIVANQVGTITSSVAKFTVTPIPTPTLGPVGGLSTVEFFPTKGQAGDKVRMYGVNLQYTLEVRFGDDTTPGTGFLAAKAASFVIESNGTLPASLLITVPADAPLTATHIQVKSKNAIPAVSTLLFTRTASYANDFANTNIRTLTSGSEGLLGDNTFAQGITSLGQVYYLMRFPKITRVSVYCSGLPVAGSGLVMDPSLEVYREVTGGTTFNGPNGVTKFPYTAQHISNIVGYTNESVSLTTDWPGQFILIMVRSSNPVGIGYVGYGPFQLALVASPLTTDYASSTSPSSQGVVLKKSAVAQGAWTSSNSAAGSVVPTKENSGQRVQFGGSAAAGTEPIVLWNESGDQPVGNGRVVTSFTMSLEEGQLGGDDQFAWQVSNPEGNPLLALWVNAADGSIRSVQPDGTTHNSLQHITPGAGSHRFEITVDPAAGTWITMMDGVPVTAPVPLPAGARFGDISAVWDLGADGQSSGASIIFDDFAVEAEQVP